LVAMVLVRHRSPPAPTPTTGINRPRLPLPYVANVCFRCFSRFKGMLQLFIMDVAKVDWGMFHMLHVFQKHAASVCSKCFICFQTYVAIVFYLDVSYVFTHMLQQYVPKCFICFSLLLQQVFLCCKLEVCLSGHCICFRTYDVSVLSGCCLAYHGFQVFLGVFASVSNACFQTYVAIVTSGCFKTRSSVAISPRCQAWEGGGGPHWHGAGSTCLPEDGQQTRGAGRPGGAAAWAFGRPGVSHSLFILENMLMYFTLS